ncbi:MAG: ribosome maturation factor RimP [Gemmatimonadetes bacterium]|nr:ribosome maturation factor RimP [Gemmatimonadota bacterium]
MIADVEAVVTTALGALELDLVDFRRRGSSARPIFEIRVDRRDGAKVTVDDCARASRAIEAGLDAGVLTGKRYVLEVSSPGMERPLKRVEDWRRFTGRLASVKTEVVVGGHAECTIVGVEGDPGAEVIVLQDAKGQHHVPLDRIAEARLAFHWTA